MSSATSPQNAKTFLLCFHAANAGCTSKTFAGCKTEFGLSSYELLIEGIPLGSRILDLGCGDGFLLSQCIHAGHQASALTGIDISPDELHLAMSRSNLSDVRFRQCCATALPFPSGEFNAVLSHLAFMFAQPIHAAIKEAARVLQPGGRLRCVMGGGPAISERPNAVEMYLQCAESFVRKVPHSIPTLVDPRLRKPTGLHSIFAEQSHFCSPAIEYEYVEQVVDFETAYMMMKTLYESAIFDSDVDKRLQETFRQQCSAVFEDLTQIPCRWALQIFDAIRL